MTAGMKFACRDISSLPCLFLLLLVVLFSSPALAGFRVFTESLSVTKKFNEVTLSFRQGIRLVSSEGFGVRANEGKVILSTRGFPELPEEIEREEVASGRLPEFPNITFSKKSVLLLRLAGGVSLKSKDFIVSGSAVETRNGGDSWRLIGEFSLAFSDGSGRRIVGRSFVYDRVAGLISTSNPVRILGFAKSMESATLEARKITLNLRSRLFSLKGSSRLLFEDYILSCDEILANLNSGIIETRGPATLRTAESLIEAERIRIQIEGGSVKVSGSGLSGTVRVK